MGRLARRIAAWTTNSLLTAMLLVIAIGFGRQVLIWWKASPDELNVSTGPVVADDGLGDPSRVHLLQFGDQNWSIRRQTIAGREVAKALRAACREVLDQVTAPVGDPGETERHFLAELRGRPPAEALADRWQIFEETQGFPMAVGLRCCERDSTGKRDHPVVATTARVVPVKAGTVPGNVPDAPLGGKLVELRYRVVVWGVGVPSGSGGWTLYTFHSVKGDSPIFVDTKIGTVPVEPVPGACPEPPLPPQCTRLASIRVAGGGAVVAFAGSNPPESIMGFYDQWFARQGWKRAQPWQSAGSARQARYDGTDGPPASVDVRLGSNQQGQSTGLLVVSPGKKE